MNEFLVVRIGIGHPARIFSVRQFDWNLVRWGTFTGERPYESSLVVNVLTLYVVSFISGYTYTYRVIQFWITTWGFCK